MENLFIREGWIITLCVLLYTIWGVRLFKNKVIFRIVIPFVISLVLHSLRYLLRTDVDVVKYISDVFYDYFAPIGIYRCGFLIAEQFRKRKE